MFKSSFYRVQREKLGNILIYISDRTKSNKGVYPSLTKVLKLLYLIDETSVKKSGVPITWLDYYAWKRGPVASDVYFEVERLKKKQVIDTDLTLDDFITSDTQEHKSSKYTSITPKKEFNDRIFSKYEMNVINEVLKKYGKKKAQDLEDETHKEGTLYDSAVKNNNLQTVFKIKGDSKVVIEFIHLIENDPLRLLAYKSAYESLTFDEELVC